MKILLILFISSILIIPKYVNTQRVFEKKNDKELEIVHKATFNFSLMYEFTLKYQLGFRVGKSTFFLGFGPGFYTHSFKHDCNFLGVRGGFEYNYGKKWSFVAGLTTYNGWNWKWDHISPYGACTQRSKSLINIPIGFAYNSNSGFTIGLEYFPMFEFLSRGNSFYPFNFNFKIGFSAITK